MSDIFSLQFHAFDEIKMSEPIRGQSQIEALRMEPRQALNQPTGPGSLNSDKLCPLRF